MSLGDTIRVSDIAVIRFGRHTLLIAITSWHSSPQFQPSMLRQPVTCISIYLAALVGTAWARPVCSTARSS
eukprot:364714-Chlamydomonas_euryale.AAC.4